tara:strand:- start:1178 stop:1393 length:216 start_codon:yes stop_codon:yes gene_type:complete
MSNEKFKDLAVSRVNKAINQIRLIGNLANKNYYSYSDEEVKKIFSALESELKSSKEKFKNSKTRGNKGFSL